MAENPVKDLEGQIPTPPFPFNLLKKSDTLDIVEERADLVLLAKLGNTPGEKALLTRNYRERPVFLEVTRSLSTLVTLFFFILSCVHHPQLIPHAPAPPGNDIMRLVNDLP